jgi:hypothetical protein
MGVIEKIKERKEIRRREEIDRRIEAAKKTGNIGCRLCGRMTGVHRVTLKKTEEGYQCAPGSGCAREKE